MEELLLGAGVVEEEPDGDDLRLTEEFERAWYRRIEQVRYGDRALRWIAAIHGVDPDDLAVEDGPDGFVVGHDGSPIEEWPSEASFLAGVVARPTLEEWLPEARWEEFSPEERRTLTARLLVFLERCPSCDDTLEFQGETADGSTDDGPGGETPADGTTAGESGDRPDDGPGDEPPEPVRVSLRCPGCGATILRGSYE